MTRESVGFRTKYILAIVAAITLVIGLIVQTLGFHPIVYYSFFLISIFSAGRWIIPNGIRSIAKAHLGISFLMTVAAVGALLIGEPAEGAAVMFLFYVAELLESKAGEKVRVEIESLLELEPDTVTIVEDGNEYCTAPDHVKAGQLFSVKPGERIGLDGIVAQGRSTVNQAPITGESLPVDKDVGDEVFAGTINIDGYLVVEVTRESKDSVLSRIVKLVQDARNSKSPTERFVSRFSHVYTPIVILGSILMALFTFVLVGSVQYAIYRGLTLLVISCPCAFAISIPVSMVSSIVGSARDGVLVKGSDHLENLSKVKTVALDKTGTLTQGDLSLLDICLHNGASRQDVLSAAIALENMSEHPIAQAILRAGNTEGIETSQAEEFIAIPGRGVKGVVDNETYLVGNQKLLVAEQIELPDRSHECGIGTMVYVVREKTHLGTVILGDSVRPTTKEAISDLKNSGIYTVMLTGDSNDIAQETAKALGVDEVYAELLPQEKVEKIRELTARGTTVMVGDGINDTPALAAADIGIAMGVISSDAAIETADIALMEEDLRKIPKLIRRAKRTMRIVKENVILSISLKLFIGFLAIIGVATLWTAILFGDMGLTLVVIANALRLTRKRS